MRNSIKILTLLMFPLLVCCCSNVSNENGERDNVATESTLAVDSVGFGASGSSDAGLLIPNEPVFETILLDADGNMNYSVRNILHKNTLLKTHYQRVACSSDTCKQEFVTYAAVQYPTDSLMQKWLSGVLGSFYTEASRQMDIMVNGEHIEVNDEGEMVVSNTGCRPYEGILSDEGKTMFDYYQARLWVIGKGRAADEHGPGGRYGCVAYRCWQSPRIASYFVGYSTAAVHNPVHCVFSFDRKTGVQLDLTDIVKEDCIAEFNDIVADEARNRHYQLKRSNSNGLAIEEGDCNYLEQLQITSVGYTRDGLAVGTLALAFDQWANATHILIIPYARVSDLIVKDYFR